MTHPYVTLHSSNAYFCAKSLIRAVSSYWFTRWPAHTAGGHWTGWTEERGNHSRLVGGEYHKPGNMCGRLSWTAARQADLRIHHRDLKSLYKVCNYTQSCVQLRWSQQHLISQNRDLAAAPTGGRVCRAYVPRMGRGEPLITPSRFLGQRASTSRGTSSSDGGVWPSCFCRQRTSNNTRGF